MTVNFIGVVARSGIFILVWFLPCIPCVHADACGEHRYCENNEIPLMTHAALQCQNAVTAYLRSKQLRLLSLAACVDTACIVLAN